ncbi:MAG: ribbon-helix-helix domain-containing protein [Cypionkella sp.]|jgi:predicted DNA-binding ribbon-helix-helix protein
MSARPAKHSVTLHGHRTSVSLEQEFWAEFQALAERRGQTLNALAAEIDAGRSGDVGLASAIRVFILAELRRSSAP